MDVYLVIWEWCFSRNGDVFYIEGAFQSEEMAHARRRELVEEARSRQLNVFGEGRDDADWDVDIQVTEVRVEPSPSSHARGAAPQPR